MGCLWIDNFVAHMLLHDSHSQVILENDFCKPHVKIYCDLSQPDLAIHARQIHRLPSVKSFVSRISTAASTSDNTVSVEP